MADLSSVGWKQNDPFPGGMAAIDRVLSHEEGTRAYDHVKPTPRGWLCVAPFSGNALVLQGYVGTALERGSRLLEARVPRLSDNRIEEWVSDAMVMFGGQPFRRVVPPWIWLRK